MIVKHTIEIEVADEAEARLSKATLDKYVFKASGVKTIDSYYNNFHFLITPEIKKMVRKKK